MNNYKSFINELKVSLSLPLPGRASQMLMAPEGKRPINPKTNKKSASVMLLLFPENDEARLVFIKRSDYDGIHSGQVSFPGGRVEIYDEDLMETALRETYEEIGIAATEIDVIGNLTPLHIPVSNFIVYPFVGYMNYKPEFRPNPNEVKFMITSEISLFLEPSTIIKEKWDLFGELIKVPFFNIENEKIWGATAMILSEFIEVILKSGLHQSSDQR